MSKAAGDMSGSDAKPIKRGLWLVLLAALFTSSLTSCHAIRTRFDLLMGGAEEEKNFREGSFTIDPNTILETLAQGGKNVFFLLRNTPEPTATAFVTWSQADYFQIAQALNQFMWEESWQDWQVKIILFRSNCQAAEKGWQKFGISLFKIVPGQKEDSRLQRDIDILPLEDTVKWADVENFPVREQWDTIDLTKIKVPADEALKIAEKNGGANARSSVKNECDIWISLVGFDQAKGWQISYSHNTDSTDIFAINIDPTSGEIIKK